MVTELVEHPELTKLVGGSKPVFVNFVILSIISVINKYFLYNMEVEMVAELVVRPSNIALARGSKPAPCQI